MSDTPAESIESKLVFTSDGHDFTIRDVIDAAEFRGEMEPVWNELLRLVAAEAKADAEGRQFNDDAIDTAAEQFRYEHDLITAEETENWLLERGVRLTDFSAYFVRHYWGDKFPDVEPEAVDFFAAPGEVRALRIGELILSGALDQMAQRLCGRVGARCAAGAVEVDPALVAEEETRFRERAGQSEEDVSAWLDRIGRDQEWFREMLTMEVIHRRDRQSVLSQQAREREIASLRLPLTRFEVEMIELDSLDAAREALLCARDDGMSMEEVASEGRYPYRHPEVLLEEIPEDLQQKFLSVHPGDILEPIARGDGFHICRVIGKAEPDLEDPLVKKRAEEAILERHFADLTTRYIKWRTLLA